jgi:aspartyl-tRNA(Asn)/glutamyl-tRNA(Gln) amidotransferase subunit A
MSPTPRSDDLPDLFEMSTRIRDRDVSPVELLDDTLSRIDRVNHRLNAYITVLHDDARAAAETAEREIRSGRYRGALHGVPLSVKDVYYTRGIRTTAGSRVLRDFVPEEDATVVGRLRAAGAVLIAKANSMEFAYGSVHPDHGPALNPWDVTRSSSGSSNGSGVAVAAGLDFGSFGTDTGGSIRLPASYCGIAGLKPTYGRVSRFGIIPLSTTLDHAGPMARSVRDVAMLLGAVAGHDPLDATSAASPVPQYAHALRDDLQGTTVAVVRNFMGPDVAPEVRTAVEEALGVLRDAGAAIADVEIPELGEPAFAARKHLTEAEASHYHRRWLADHEDDYTPLVLARLKKGFALPAVTYIEALAVRERLRRRLREIHWAADLLVLPTAPTSAMPLPGPVLAADVDRREAEVKDVGRHTSPFNVTGQPALSLPCGFSSEGHPIGLQIVGRELDEPLVLRAGYAYQCRTAWHRRRPPHAVET